VTRTAPESAVLSEVIALAESLAGKTARTLAAIKKGLYDEALRALEARALGGGFS
jgi:hypothetical protein